MCSDHSMWKSLTDGALSTDKHISMITMIFSNSNQVKIIRNLSQDDAQAVIDKIDELGCCVIQYPGDQLSSTQTIALSTRCWIVSHHKYIGTVCAIYPKYVVARSCSRDRRKSRFATIQRRTHFLVVGLQACGRANGRARVLRSGSIRCGREATLRILKR
jgi:hypothetical protein